MAFRTLSQLLGGTAADTGDTPGEPAETKFIGFGEDGTSSIANRPHRALAENTDFLKAAIDQEHDSATGFHTDITPDSVVTKIADGAGKIVVQAGSGDIETVQFQIKNAAATDVFTVDEDGDLVCNDVAAAAVTANILTTNVTAIGTKVIIQADAGDSEQPQIVVKNTGGSTVWSVDEDGDVISNSLTTASLGGTTITSVAGVGGDSKGHWARDHFYFRDDFFSLGRADGPGGSGALTFWVESLLGGSTGAVSLASFDNNEAGAISVATSGGASHETRLEAPSTFGIDSSQFPNWAIHGKWRAVLNVTSNIEAELSFEGDATNYIRFFYDSAVSPNWQAEVNDNGTPHTSSTSVVASASSYKTFEIHQVALASFEFWIDGVYETVINFRPTGTPVVRPVVGALNKTSGIKAVFVDAIEVYSTRWPELP